MSFGRTQQLQDLQQIIQEMSKEIMWVNGREEEELMFDWGDKNIDQYIPRKQESYSVSETYPFWYLDTKEICVWIWIFKSLILVG